MLSPEAKKRIYEAARSQLEAQIQRRIQAQKSRDRRIGCLSLLLLVGLIISLAGSERDKEK